MNEDDGEVLDCRKCELEERYCPSCPVTAGQVPKITPEIGFWLDTYNRAKTFRVLPVAGGLFDQEERVMKILDAIDAVVEKHESRKRKKVEAQAEAASSVRGSGGRRAWR